MMNLKVVELMNDRLCEVYKGFLESVDGFCKEKAKKLGCTRMTFGEVVATLEHGGFEVSLSAVDCEGGSVGFFDPEDEQMMYWADDFDSSEVLKILKSIDKTAVADNDD